MINKDNIFLYGGIGLKRLSDADIGRAGRSHQTHIGLLGNTVTLEKNEFYTKLVYENIYYHGISTIDFITNPDGSTRSPKLRTGENYDESTYKKIKELCIKDKEYHILYVQTAIDEIHFVLFYTNSNLHTRLVEILEYNTVTTKNPWKKFENWSEVQKQAIRKLLYALIKVPEKDHEKEIEDIILSGGTSVPRTIKEEDFEKIRASCQETGRKGEELLNNYLINQRNSQNIKDFIWLNENHESYKPFDFEITNIAGTINYVDAKTTKHSFEQPFYMSLQEIEFSSHNPYSIYRLYNIENSPKCSKTDKISTLGTDFWENYTSFKNMISSKDYSIGQINIKFKPESPVLEFDEVSL